MPTGSADVPGDLGDPRDSRPRTASQAALLRVEAAPCRRSPALHRDQGDECRTGRRSGRPRPLVMTYGRTNSADSWPAPARHPVLSCLNTSILTGRGGQCLAELADELLHPEGDRLPCRRRATPRPRGTPLRRRRSGRPSPRRTRPAVCRHCSWRHRREIGDGPAQRLHSAHRGGDGVGLVLVDSLERAMSRPSAETRMACRASGHFQRALKHPGQSYVHWVSVPFPARIGGLRPDCVPRWKAPMIGRGLLAGSRAGAVLLDPTASGTDGDGAASVRRLGQSARRGRRRPRRRPPGPDGRIGPRR